MRGLKHDSVLPKWLTYRVASFTDAWIETYKEIIEGRFDVVASFTDAWIETLKYPRSFIQLPVASFTDAWIETQVASDWLPSPGVASFTDAWIETIVPALGAKILGSHLLQMRGLKPSLKGNNALYQSRIFYRCVD